MLTRTHLLELVTGLLHEHENTITNALQNQARHMREAAAGLQASYDAIKDDPGACAHQDETMVTTHGLATMARMFTEAAELADSALAALEALAAELEDAGS